MLSSSKFVGGIWALCVLRCMCYVWRMADLIALLGSFNVQGTTLWFITSILSTVLVARSLCLFAGWAYWISMLYALANVVLASILLLKATIRLPDTVALIVDLIFVGLLIRSRRAYFERFEVGT